jgi:hypothetical protein
MDDFSRLARCHGLKLTQTRYPDDEEEAVSGLAKFREAVINSVRSGGGGPAADPHCNNCGTSEHASDVCTSTSSHQRRSTVLVVSFSRRLLKQTGDGHFSPIGGYDEANDRVLVLDVARFKYPPYWVPLSELYNAMKGIDPSTNKPRGYFVVKRESSRHSNSFVDQEIAGEYVKAVEDSSACPVNQIKVKYCKKHKRVEAMVVKGESNSFRDSSTLTSL